MHSFYMKKALMQAQVALHKQEVPVGAVVVDKDGIIIARGHNTTEHKGCQTGHAEMNALKLATKKRGNWRLDDCILYVTLEPCLMCFGLCRLSRIRGIVYGSPSPLFGSGLDKTEHFPLYRKDLFVTGGVMADVSIDLLRRFFRQRRQKKGQ